MSKFVTFFLKYWGWFAGAAVVLIVFIFRKKIFGSDLRDTTQEEDNLPSNKINFIKLIPRKTIPDGTPCREDGKKISDSNPADGIYKDNKCINPGHASDSPDTISMRHGGRPQHKILFNGQMYKLDFINKNFAQYSKITIKNAK